MFSLLNISCFLCTRLLLNKSGGGLFRCLLCILCLATANVKKIGVLGLKITPKNHSFWLSYQLCSPRLLSRALFAEFDLSPFEMSEALYYQNVEGWGPSDNIRPRSRQMTRTNTRKIEPTYSNAICNLTAGFFLATVGGSGTALLCAEQRTKLGNMVCFCSPNRDIWYISRFLPK